MECLLIAMYGQFACCGTIYLICRHNGKILILTNTKLLIKAKPRTIALEDTNLVGNVHSLRVSRETHESLLETESSDHSVDLLALHSVELVDGITDLLLVSTEINKEGEDVLRLHN